MPNLYTYHVKKLMLSLINFIGKGLYFHYSIIIADLEARIEPIFDEDKQQCETIDICKQIPCCNGFYEKNKSIDLPIEMGYYKSPFGQNNISWFLYKINKIEFQMRKIFKLNRKPKKTIKSD